jgi:hypothetical protein
VLIFHPRLVHFVAVWQFVLVRVQQRAVAGVVAVVVVIAVEIAVVHVDIAAVVDNNNMAGAIVLCIEEDPVVDSIDIVGVPVAVDSIDTGFVVEADRVDNRVDIVEAEADMFYRAELLQDKKDKMGKVDMLGMVDKEGKGHMVWAKVEEMAFYMLVEDTLLDEWAMVQNCNYHNSLHSILVYIYRYHNIFHNNLYCIYLVCNTFCNDSCLICSLYYNPGSI